MIIIKRKNKKNIKITQIIKIKSHAYKILMYLLASHNPKNNYALKIYRSKDCCTGDRMKTISRLIELGLITSERDGRTNYLNLTSKGRNIVEILFKLEGMLK